MDSLCVEAPGLLQESLHHHDLVITISVLCYFGLLRDHTTIKRQGPFMFTGSGIMLQDDHPI